METCALDQRESVGKITEIQPLTTPFDTGGEVMEILLEKLPPVP